GWLLLTELAVALLLVWTLLAWVAQGSSGRAISLALSMACVSAGATIMLSKYATGGQMGMPMGGALAGIALVALVLPTSKHGQATLSVGVVLLFSLVVIGRFFGELTT